MFPPLLFVLLLIFKSDFFFLLYGLSPSIILSPCLERFQKLSLVPLLYVLVIATGLSARRSSLKTLSSESPLKIISYTLFLFYISFRFTPFYLSFFYTQSFSWKQTQRQTKTNTHILTYHISRNPLKWKIEHTRI